MSIKDRFKYFFSFIYKLIVLCDFRLNQRGGLLKLPNVFFKSFCNIRGLRNSLFLYGVSDDSSIFINGNGNSMKIESSLIYKSTIRVSGNNNRVHFEEGVMFRKSEINLRGNNCVVKIGKGTTFGGVRIVNVGTDNVVEIGCNCLFSDFIEIWASDTHSILNEQGEWINYEKPIRIGNRVWVGSRVIILKGISVNDDSIIGMGTIVTKDVPSNVVIAGLPNRIVKEGVSWTLNYGK